MDFIFLTVGCIAGAIFMGVGICIAEGFREVDELKKRLSALETANQQSNQPNP